MSNILYVFPRVVRNGCPENTVPFKLNIIRPAFVRYPLNKVGILRPTLDSNFVALFTIS
jgi:hypothetical protein